MKNFILFYIILICTISCSNKKLLEVPGKYSVKVKTTFQFPGENDVIKIDYDTLSVKLVDDHLLISSNRLFIKDGLILKMNKDGEFSVQNDDDGHGGNIFGYGEFKNNKFTMKVTLDNLASAIFEYDGKKIRTN